MAKLTIDKEARKDQPIVRGLLDYFPNAVAAVANVSVVGNRQHNPGEPLHWAREKSDAMPTLPSGISLTVAPSMWTACGIPPRRRGVSSPCCKPKSNRKP